MLFTGRRTFVLRTSDLVQARSWQRIVGAWAEQYSSHTRLKGAAQAVAVKANISKRMLLPVVGANKNDDDVNSRE